MGNLLKPRVCRTLLCAVSQWISTVTAVQQYHIVQLLVGTLQTLDDPQLYIALAVALSMRLNWL